MNKIEKMRPRGMHDKVLLLREKCGVEFFLKENRSFVSMACPACGCGKNQVFRFNKYGFCHLECAACRTLYVSPRPQEKSLFRYYTRYEAPAYWTSILIETNDERKKLQHLPRVRKLKEIIDNSDNSRETFVDIGAGNGNFSAAVKEGKIFKKVIAADVSEKCVRACKDRGLETWLGTINDFKANSLDCIAGNDMIEHLYDPAAFMRTCHSKLKKNGVVMFSTPNGEGFDFKILSDKTENITPPEHLQYFNTGSIRIFLESAGFSVMEITTPGILDVEIIKKQVACRNFDLKGRNEFLSFMFNMKNEGLENTFQDFLVKNGLSSHMLLFAIKRVKHERK